PQAFLHQDIIERFHREARLVSRLQHPNLVTLFDFGQSNGVLYMVMELLRGQPLSEILDEGYVFPLSTVLVIAEQLASALIEVHEQGVIHRDLKPENIFLEQVANGFHVKLIDFGVAILDEPQLQRLTAVGQLQGTPHYMSPEQIDGQEATPRSDLYALGVMFYEMLAGRPPFTGETLMAVLYKHLSDEPQPLSETWALNEPLCLPLVELVEELIAKDPAQRPESALEVWERLGAMVQEPEAEAPPHLKRRTPRPMLVEGPLPGGLSRSDRDLSKRQRPSKETRALKGAKASSSTDDPHNQPTARLETSQPRPKDPIGDGPNIMPRDHPRTSPHPPRAPNARLARPTRASDERVSAPLKASGARLTTEEKLMWSKALGSRRALWPLAALAALLVVCTVGAYLILPLTSGSTSSDDPAPPRFQQPPRPPIVQPERVVEENNGTPAKHDEHGVSSDGDPSQTGSGAPDDDTRMEASMPTHPQARKRPPVQAQPKGSAQGNRKHELDALLKEMRTP
ncbi:MAG: serine/threonine-protein kinase, partial [Myxococcota bacterium]